MHVRNCPINRDAYVGSCGCTNSSFLQHTMQHMHGARRSPELRATLNSRDITVDRRQHLLFISSLGLFVSQILHDSEHSRSSALAAEAEASMSPSAADIYSSYQYQRPQDILTFIRDHAREGEADEVIRAIDSFSLAFPMYKIGPEKGQILDELVKVAVPREGLVVELGSFVGYSAVRIARLLPPGARLVCVEANLDCCETIKAVLSHAGLRDRVIIEQGLSNEILPGLYERYGQCNLLFEDHCKPCYLPDLLTAEDTGLMGPGSFTIADNVIYPGAPELLTHLGTSLEAPDDEGGAGARSYQGFVVKAKYEYEQKWRMGEERLGDKVDGMSIGVRLSGLGEGQRDASTLALNKLRSLLEDELHKEVTSL